MSKKLTALSFNARNVPPQSARVTIPADKYTVKIIDGEVIATKDKTGTRIRLDFEVVDGEHVGAKFTDGLNIKSTKSPKAEEIGNQQLSAICHAVQVFDLTDVSQLFHKPFVAKVGMDPARVENGESYDARNTFKGVVFAGQQAAAATASAAPSAPPWEAPKAAAGPAAPVPSWAVPTAPVAPPAPAATLPPPPAPPKAERVFFVYLGANNMPKMSESEIIAKGVTGETQVCEEGGSTWTPLSSVGLTPAAPSLPPPPSAVAPWQR